MPSGTYLHRDGDDGPPLALEAFRAAPGPAGWRYTAVLRDLPGERELGRLDVTADTRWHQLRVEARARGTALRGGVTGLRTLWVAGDREQSADAAGFVGRSPGLLVPCARALGLRAGDAAEVRHIRLGWPALSAAVVTQRWTLLEVREQPTGAQPLPVERFEISVPDGGPACRLYLAGDVVLDAPGLELTELASPPTLPAE